MTPCRDSGGLTEKQEIELDKLINKPKARTEKQEIKMLELISKRDRRPEYDLSEGAKSFVKSLVKQRCYNYNLKFDAKQTEKGTVTEDDCIELYNTVYYTEYKKNEVRKYGDFIEGECDIDAPEDDLIIDIKSSFTKETFPAIEEDIPSSGYEWQGRGYMKLYNRSNFILAYCLVSTPFELLGYEKNLSLHIVEENPIELPPALRVTTKSFKRCPKMDALIEHKVKECRRYANWYFSKIVSKN